MEDEKRLFVGRLPLDIKPEEIKVVFNTYGVVSDVHILEGSRDIPGSGPQRVAFVSYETGEAAKVAVQVLNKVYKFREDAPEPVDVSIARPRGGKDGGKGGGDSYGGGKGYSDKGYDKGGWDKGGWDKGAWDKGYGKGGYPPFDPWAAWGYDPKGWGKGYPPFDPYGKGGYGFDKGGYGPAKGGWDQGKAGGGWDQGKGAGWDQGKGGGGWDKGGFGASPPAGDPKGGFGNSYSPGGDSYGGKPDNGGKGGGSSGGGGGRREAVGNKLYLGNLPGDITKEAITMVFGTYGSVQDVHIMSGRAKSGQACAFLTYENAEEAKTAIAAMANGYEIRPGEGNIIVKYPNEQKSGGDFGKGGGKDDRFRAY